MTNLTSLVLRRKDVEEQKPTLKQQFKSKFQLQKKEIKSTWKSLLPSRHKPKDVIINQHKENTVGPILTINVPITIYNTNVNNYNNTDKNNNEIAPSSTTSIVKQLIVLSPYQIYGFLFVCILLLLVVGFGILQVHRIITIFQSLIDGIKFLLVGLVSKSFNLLSFFFS